MRLSVVVLMRLAILESAEKHTLKIGTVSRTFYRNLLFGVGFLFQGHSYGVPGYHLFAIEGRHALAVSA